MPVRIPASELYQIQEDDLRNAIANFREGALPRPSKIPRVSTCSWTDTGGFRPKQSWL
jgi:hypothetical protein